MQRRRAGARAAPPPAAGRSARPRIVAFARLMRWAIVASGTRNALAISAVVSPPTARSVSAICDARRQRRVAAEQQERERVVVLARALGAWRRRALVGDRDRRGALLAPAPRDVAARPRRRAGATPRPRATPAGARGRPRPGHCRDAASSASWTASSQASNGPYRRTSTPSTCGASSRSSPSITSPSHAGVHDRPDLHRAELRARPRGGDLHGALDGLALDHEVAAEVLLRLRQRPVGHHRDALLDADRPRVRRVGECLAPDELARLGQPSHHGVDLRHQVLALRAW